MVVLRIATVLTLFSTISALPLQAGGTVTGKIIQYKNDRLYIDQGIEANIFSGSPFVVVQGNDTLLVSAIDQSYEGVSISLPIGRLSDSLNWTDYPAIIYPAPYDSSAVIRVVTDINNLSLASSAVLTRSEDGSDSIAYNGGISLTVLPDRIDLLHEFHQKDADGILSFTDYSRQLPGTELISTPAPFIAVLIPNLSSPVNLGTALTTSLYYRFDDQRLGLYFDGDRVQPVYSLRFENNPATRPYPYDDNLGRQLFSRVSGAPKRVNLFVGDPALQKLADYLGDILSRDRCLINPVNDPSDADVSLEFILADRRSPTATIVSLLDLAESGIRSNSPFVPIIHNCRQQLEWGTHEADSSRADYHLRLCTRRLTDDLGVFPLFRPTLHFTSRPDVRGVTVTADGRIDLAEGRLIIMNEPALEAAP